MTLTICLVEYLYQNKRDRIKASERNASVRKKLCIHKGRILRDKGIGKRVKVKAICAIMGMD